MPNGFADAFLDSVFKTRSENAERQRFAAQLQFEQAKQQQEFGLQQQRADNEKNYQQSMIADAQQRMQQEQAQREQQNKAAAFGLISQGLATPVQPQMNTNAAPAPLQNPMGEQHMPSNPGLEDLNMQSGGISPQSRQGPLAQGPAGSMELGGQFLQPRTVEERMSAEQKQKMVNDRAAMADRHQQSRTMMNDFLNDPNNKMSESQKQGLMTWQNMNEVAEQMGKNVTVGDLKEIMNPGGHGPKDLGLNEASDIMSGIKVPGWENVTKEQAAAVYKLLKPPKPGNDSSTMNRNYRSFHDSTAELDKLSKTFTDETDTLRRAVTVLDSPNAASDPFVAPAMNSLFSRRQSEAELKRINGGRSTVEGAKVAWDQLLTGKSISDVQRRQLHDMVNGMIAINQEKQKSLSKAYNDLDPDDTPSVHSKIVHQFRDEQNAVQEKALGGASTQQGGLDVSKIRGILDAPKTTGLSGAK